MDDDREPPWLVVGHLNKPHGTKGEFFVWPLTDREETIFAEGSELLVSDLKGEVPDERFPPLKVEGVRPFRTGRLLRFEGVGSRNQADLLRNRYLLIPFAEAEPLEEGDVFYHQLLGMAVVTVDGTEVGKVSEVYELDPADMLEVRGAERSLLVPFTKQIVTSVDPEERRIVIDPPEGLLDL
ncbi:MAG: ribosome maturation factor RimM [Gemmatimonadota bacterium]